jgi:hypothetical protein
VRFVDFLRIAVLLFAGGATACAVVALAGAQSKEDTTLIYIALAWWVIAALTGGWLGRRAAVTEGIGRLLSSARTQPALPELEPGTIMFNRLWPLALVVVVSGGLAFVIPQVPAVATGYLLLVALLWRRQSYAVQAIEERDGVRFYVERTSAFRPTRLLRTPGFRKNEPAPTDVQRTGVG